MELSVDNESFMEFELKGTFTHITYDCGHGGLVEHTPDVDPNKKTPEEQAAEEAAKQQEEEEEEPEDDWEDEEEEEDEEDPWDEYEDEDEDEDEDDWWDDEDEEGDDEDQGLRKGSVVLNAAEMNQTANTPNGGTVQIQGSIPSSVKFGNDRDEDPSPEEQELARDTADKLNDAGNELQQKLQDILNMPSSDDPADQDKEESWIPSPSDEEKPEETFLDKLKNLFKGDDKDEEGSNDFSVFRDSPDDRDTPMTTDPDSGSRMADEGDHDSVTGSPNVVINASPPLSKEQKQAVVKAMKEYNQKVNKIADDFEKRKEELKDESELPDEEEEEEQEQTEEDKYKQDFVDKYPWCSNDDVNPKAVNHYGEETIKQKPWLATVDFPGDGDEEREAAGWWKSQKQANFESRW